LGGRLETLDQLVARVLQAEHEQQQDDSDLGAGVDELVRGDEGKDSTLAEGETTKKIKGDRGDTQPTGDAGQQGEDKDDAPDLEE